MISISMCMIVKNEQDILARCLDSYAGTYDELIIVDTGSTDNTKEIAAHYTDKIYDFEWINDFSAARNFAFSKAGCDYIFSADADEVLDDTNNYALRELKHMLLPEIDIVQMYDAMFELYKIKAFLKNQNLKVTLLLIDMEEYKLLNGWSYDKKRGSVRYDRIPVGIRKIVELDCPQDYMQFVPEGLEKNFTSADFANAAHIDRQTAASVLAMLNYMEQVKRVGKTGNAYIYDIEEHY